MEKLIHDEALESMITVLIGVNVDDRQVHRVLVQKFEPGNVFGFEAPSPILQDALGTAKPVLYVRLSDDPFEDLA